LLTEVSGLFVFSLLGGPRSLDELLDALAALTAELLVVGISMPELNRPFVPLPRPSSAGSSLSVRVFSLRW